MRTAGRDGEGTVTPPCPPNAPLKIRFRSVLIRAMRSQAAWKYYPVFRKLDRLDRAGLGELVQIPLPVTTCAQLRLSVLEQVARPVFPGLSRTVIPSVPGINMGHFRASMSRLLPQQPFHLSFHTAPHAADTKALAPLWHARSTDSAVVTVQQSMQHSSLEKRKAGKWK